MLAVLINQTILKKQRLFKIGVKALQSISDLDKDVYVCPICLRGFYFESISNKELTIEHAPQESIGGKGLLLTCARCNKEAGHKIDAELHKREKSISFLKALTGNGSFSGRLKLIQGDQSTNVNVSAENGKVHIKVPEKINPPDYPKKIFGHLENIVQEKELWSKEKFKLNTVYPFHKHKANVADLKSAYLLVFASLGYSYIIQNILSKVREQILNPEQKILTGIYLDLDSSFPEERKIIALKLPFEAAIVQIDRRLIFLPPMNSSDDFFDTLKSFIKKNKKGKLNGVELGWPKTMEMKLDLPHG